MVASTDIDHRLLRTHLIGIGGAGMSGIARILLARGAAVSGSDAKDSRTVLALRAQGAVVAVGHEAANLDPPADGPTCVVVSTAIRPDNPELAAARERGIPVLRRAEALALLMAGQRVACVAGTHGKTSTTSMLTVALQHCRLDPSFAIGGDLNESGANAHHGTGGIFVAEADESDGSLLVFEPSVAVVTNVEADHLDHHGTVEAYVGVFDAFLDRITPGGVLIACGDDPGAARLAERGEARGLRVLRYGRHLPDGASGARLGDYRPVDGGGEVDLELITADGAPGERISLRVSTPGRHMADNAAAALLAGAELGAPVDRLVEGLAAFGGVRRRFEPKGVASGVRVYDDYAHHPTEVAAQLDACGPLLDGGRLIVVFQPHLYSRTELFADGFAEALRKADEVIVLDVFGAREAPRPGVTGALIADRVPGARFAASVAEVPALIAGMARPGDLVLTMGAGDVTMLGPEILTEIDRVDAGPDT